MKPYFNTSIRASVLFVLTAIVGVSAFIVFQLISDGLSSQMMGFEREPAGGWAYWRWYFLKREIWGILGAFVIFLIFTGLVARAWVRLIRELSRNKTDIGP